jgi:hypothetical protein
LNHFCKRFEKIQNLEIKKTKRNKKKKKRARGEPFGPAPTEAHGLARMDPERVSLSPSSFHR